MVNMTDSAHDKPKPNAKPRPEPSYKETVESIIIAFILAFVFRAFVVEAFVIPTGSMAPTLLGKHVTLTCPQCGYHYHVGPREYFKNTDVPESIQGNSNNPLRVSCPMCNYPVSQDSRATDAGDRILVLKYLYGISEPQRWDVVVFKNPVQPRDNYIKRLVGLPNEKLWIVRGNVYTQPLDADMQKKPWTIQRKTDRPKVQRAVWQPVYHSAFVPLDGGVPDGTHRKERWKPPWHAEPGHAESWEKLHGGRAFGYLGGKPSNLLFEYRHLAGAMDYAPYNHTHPLSMPGTNIVEDMRLGTTVIPQSKDTTLTLTLQTSRYDFRAVIDGESNSPRIEVRGNGFDDWAVPDETSRHGAEQRHETHRLAAGQPTRVELWHVDQHVQLWMGGELAAEWKYDNKLPAETLLEIEEQTIENEPRISVTVGGGAAQLHDLDVDRDLYYTSQNNYLGATTRIARIGPDRFFCLGDNSPHSKDSRMWEEADKWIRYHTGRAGREVQAGYVPRQLMLGRAFFVYFPAPYRFKATGMWLIPNFGQMRFIH